MAIPQAIAHTNEITEAKEETNSKEKELRLKLTKLKEEKGVGTLKRSFVRKMIDMQEEMANGGDVSIKENGFESAQRAYVLDPKLRVLLRECGKIYVEWYMSKMGIGSVDTLAAELGLFSNEYATLFGECAKSAGELCIKKMHLEALVFSELEKMTILEREIAGAARMRNQQVEILRDFYKNLGINESDMLRAFHKKLRVNELAGKQDSQADAIVQENDVGGAVMDGKQTEISKGKVYKSDGKSRIMEIRFEAVLDELVKMADSHRMGMVDDVEKRLRDWKMNLWVKEFVRNQDSQLNKMEVQKINEVKGSAFVKESLRVLMEMMEGVKGGVSRADEAIALTDAWARIRIDTCVVKVCVGVLVHNYSIDEVLKREIAETWEMERAVEDRLVKYQREYYVKKNTVVGLVWPSKSQLYACAAVAGIIAGTAGIVAAGTAVAKGKLKRW